VITVNEHCFSCLKIIPIDYEVDSFNEYLELTRHEHTIYLCEDCRKGSIDKIKVSNDVLKITNEMISKLKSK
jgi:hypothetical protein